MIEATAVGRPIIAHRNAVQGCVPSAPTDRSTARCHPGSAGGVAVTGEGHIGQVEIAAFLANAAAVRPIIVAEGAARHFCGAIGDKNPTGAAGMILRQERIANNQCAGTADAAALGKRVGGLVAGEQAAIDRQGHPGADGDAATARKGGIADELGIGDGDFPTDQVQSAAKLRGAVIGDERMGEVQLAIIIDGATRACGVIIGKLAVVDIHEAKVLHCAILPVAARQGEVIDGKGFARVNLEQRDRIAAAQRDEAAALNLGVGRDELLRGENDRSWRDAAVEGDRPAAGGLDVGEHRVKGCFGAAGGAARAHHTVRRKRRPRIERQAACQENHQRKAPGKTAKCGKSGHSPPVLYRPIK